jgi:hypothetical protein
MKTKRPLKCFCRALCSFANDDQNKAIIAANGEITMIVEAMQQHVDHAGVQEMCCRALCSLAKNDQNKATIAANDGITIIVEAMQRHGDHVDLQVQGCRTLCYLADHNQNCWKQVSPLPATGNQLSPQKHGRRQYRLARQ